jgi:transcriptional regulator NrdR family protein
MVCIYCSGKTGVINSRSKSRINQVWRRRKCLACGAIFTTREITDFELSLTVISSDGQIRPFSRNKLFLSLHKSLAHRTSAVDDANNLVDTLIMKLNTQLQNGSLDRNTILYLSHVTLSRFDTQAAMHYQSFHKTK